MRIRLLAPVLALALVPAACGDDDGGGSSKPVANQGDRIAKESGTKDGNPEPYEQQGGIVADVGFRPETDGFSFPNYASGYENLSPREMESLFGPQVCASRQGDQCVLTPPAQAWMNAVNNEIKDGGHCFGFSVTALMMFDHALNPLDYGGATVPALQLPGNVLLQGRIAQSFVLQISPKVRAGDVKGTPNEVLDALVAALKNHPDTYTIGFYKRDGTGGHAVTPYAVQEEGGGRFAVLIYDNNFPGVPRAMHFDRNANTWEYEASPQPDIQPAHYDGDANTKTLSLIPTSPGIGVQPCPFCASPLRRTRYPVPTPTGGVRQVTVRRYEEVTLAGDSVNHAHLVLTDSRGRRTGYVNGKLLKEIPGVQVQPVLTNQNWRLKTEPRFLVPRGLKYSITLDGSTLKAPDTESVSVIGPGYSAVVSDIVVRPREKHQVTVRAKGTRLAFEAASKRTQSPDIELGFDRRGADSSVAVAAHKLKGNGRVTAVVEPSTGTVKLGGSRIQGADAVVGLTTIRRSGTRTVRQEAVRLQSKPRCNLRRGGRACRRG